MTHPSLALPLLGLAALLLLLATAGGSLRRLGQSAVPAYILLGTATSAALEYPDAFHLVQSLGVALLLFFIGLEFSILRLRRGARRHAAAGLKDLAVNFPVGVAGGLLLGWDLPSSLLLGAALYISSSAIVAQNISDLGRAANPETETALGILVVEDLVMALFLAAIALWPPLRGEGAGATSILAGLGAMALLLTVLSGPFTRAVDRAIRGLDDEAFLLAVAGLLLLFGGGALAAGLSEGLGAFVAGLLVGDSREKERVERLLSPFLGLFAALFFFGFGLSIDVRNLPGALVSGTIIGAAALAAKVAGALWIGRGTISLPARFRLGFTLVPRGEFTVLLAGYGAALGTPELRPVVAVAVIVLAVAGTLLTQHSEGVSGPLVRRLTPSPPAGEEAGARATAGAEGT